MANLSVGDQAPDFTLPGTQGPFTLSEQRGRRVVLLFYPGDNTPVCTRQMCSYRDKAEDMDALDAVVVAISAQDLASHELFVATHNLTVPLLADEDKAVAKDFGVTAPVVGTRRAVVVVDEDGRVAHKTVHTLGLRYETAEDLKAILDGLGGRTGEGAAA